MRKAISETISTLLILVIVVALGITVLSWGNQYISTLRQDIEYQAQVAEDTIKERPIIEHIVVNSTGAYIWVRNVGFSELVIDTIYIKKASTGDVSMIDVDLPLEPNEATPADNPIHITGYTFISGETYVITLVTERGSKVSYMIVY